MATAKTETLWVISNRKDDRVVLFERDALHPGGEAFVGGSGPDRVGRTPAVERLLRSGELLEIPEPPDSRKKPVELEPSDLAAMAAQPGAAVPLGRPLDPELVSADALKALQARQEDLPDEVPAPEGAIVPQPPTPERAESRRR